jgi:enamine deaminase RidA (YjgF/YER057c/UK114 family)
VAEGDRVYGREVQSPAARVLGLSDVGRRASGRLAAGPAEDAGAAIDAAEDLLAREGFSFRDVARTWFYLRDILDWYGPFNAVRNAAFRRMGLVGEGGDGQIPASTGIEGRNHRGGWCALDLLAVQPRNGGRLETRRLHNRKQNEATEYGSAFARAMEIVLGDARYIFVSGTASIDDRGATAHVGDFEAQARYTLEAVGTLLEGAGASLADVGQATAFLADPSDGRSFERIVERSGLRASPLVTTVADVCREDLLFEIDATAVVPLGRGARR